MTEKPKQKPKRETLTIDLTPTWTEILPTLLALYENGGETRTTAEQEFRKMAQAADAWNTHVDSVKKKPKKGRTK